MAKNDAGMETPVANTRAAASPRPAPRSLPTAPGASPSTPGFIRRLRQN